MKMHPAQALCAPGLFRGEMTFENPILDGYRWPLFEVQGSPGPRLCVMAGVHVNEVSSIEAAVRLQRCLGPDVLRGSVSIIPVVNLPALPKYTQYDCPIDGKNINFTFPGDPGGSFSEALCHALLFDWAGNADLHVDLHGGDLREQVSKFVMYQRSGEVEKDRLRERYARCFDADLLVGFDAAHMQQPGRALSALAKVGRHGVMSEAGANGVVDEVSVRFHLDGVLNLLRELGMARVPPIPPQRAQALCHDYIWVECPKQGLFRACVEPGQYVIAGQTLGVVRDHFGTQTARVVAPGDGYVLWRMTHPVLRAGDYALGLAVPAS